MSMGTHFDDNGQFVMGIAQVFVQFQTVTMDTKSNSLHLIQAEVLPIHSAGPSVRVELLTSAGQTSIVEKHK
jgi:hypothetical protein